MSTLENQIAELRDAMRCSDMANPDGFSNVFLSWFGGVELHDSQCGLRRYPVPETLALGARYSAEDFVQDFSLEEVREEHPGLFYEAVHHNLLAEQQPLHMDRNLRELIETTMLAKTRPDV